MSDITAQANTVTWQFIEFNERRALRGARAARVEVNGEWTWMNKNDIKKNIKTFGDHPELQKALAAYGAWA